MLQKNLIIIPARMASTRLPNKPLADIAGKTMIHRVYEQALKANAGEVIIACDGKEIAQEAYKIGAKFIITDPQLQSGTDRIYQAFLEHGGDYDTITNLQGDLPNIDPNVICSAVNLGNSSDCDIATVASVIKNRHEIDNPNIVKIALGNNSRALYFSRSAIPYCADKSGEYFHHIGIYVYKKSALAKFVKLSCSKLEKQESLEQLRALENNMTIAVAIVDAYPLSVDTQEDLEIITKLIIRNQNDVGHG
jgi:3-deoxy-manno-octulosonate cytidylyltransferase (CMP-KDO synthetase)